MKGWSPAAYVRFLVLVVAGVGILLLAGFGIEQKLETGSFAAIAAAILACGLATGLSGLLLAFPGGTPQAALSRFFVAMAARLVLVAAFSAWCLVGLGLARGPFVVSLVSSYLLFLALDTAFAVRALRGL